MSFPRAPFVIVGTLAGLAGVLAFRSTPEKVVLPSTPASSATAATQGTGASPGVPATSASSSGSGGSGAGTSSGSKGSSAGATPVTTTTSAVPSGVHSATGPKVNYYFGVLSVSVTSDGTKITKVSIGSLNDGGNPRSQYIDNIAIPILEKQAMAVQSANIQGVSGASYTSAGFAQSLQGALSALHLK